MKTGTSENLSGPVYEHLKEMILSQELRPGEKIPETKIAKLFGYSRSPIREALRRLDKEGLVNIYPNRFAEVAVIGEKEIKEIGTLRIALDLISAKLALLYGSNANFLRMKDLMTQCFEAAKNGDMRERVRLDCEFHLELGRIGKNECLIKILEDLYPRVQFLLTCKYKDIDDSLIQIEKHFDIVEALIARDEELVLELLMEHLMDFYNLEIQYPPGFFASFIPSLEALKHEKRIYSQYT